MIKYFWLYIYWNEIIDDLWLTLKVLGNTLGNAKKTNLTLPQFHSKYNALMTSLKYNWLQCFRYYSYPWKKIYMALT